MNESLTGEQLTAIEDAFAACTENALASEGPVLLGEIRRLKAELERATMPVGPGLSVDRLAGIEARERAATKGLWLPQEDYPHPVLQGPPGVRPADAEGVISTNLAVNPAADSEFIGHARQDVSDLLDEVRRQRAELAAARDALRRRDAQMDRLRTEMTGGAR